MEFTEAEAKGKVGKWVRVRDRSLLYARLTRGAQGKVVGTQLYQRAEGSSKERVWVVCLEFSLARDSSASVLLRDIDKEQYVSAFEEILAERELEGGQSQMFSPRTQ